MLIPLRTVYRPATFVGAGSNALTAPRAVMKANCGGTGAEPAFAGKGVRSSKSAGTSLQKLQFATQTRDGFSVVRV